MAQEQKYNTTDPAKDALKPVAGEMQGATTSKETVTPATLSDRSATPAPAQSPDDDDYTESISALERMRNMLQPVETPEQRAKRERREKSNMTMATVGDGLRALSNLFFTTQEAPDAYHSSQREALEHHYDKLRADRDRNADRYLQYSLRIGNLNAQRAQTQREAEAQAERIKIAQDKARREAEAHKWEEAIQPDKQREQAGNAAKAEQQAIAARAAAEAAPDMQAAKIATEKARQASYNASAANSRAAAAAHGRSNVNEFTAWDERGREHKFRTKEAADTFAKQHGTYREQDVTATRTTRSQNGRRTTTSSTTSTTKTGNAGRPSPTGKTSPTGKASPTA